MMALISLPLCIIFENTESTLRFKNVVAYMGKYPNLRLTLYVPIKRVPKSRISIAMPTRFKDKVIMMYIITTITAMISPT